MAADGTPLRYQNDQWTLDDTLGIAASGDLVARMALEAAPPFSVRVTGKWGSGKTSVIRRAFVTLNGRPVQQAVPLGENVEEAGSGQWKQWAYNAENRPQPLNWPEALTEVAGQSLAVWYSPWQHQGTENPLIPLLLEIRAHFSVRINWKEMAADANRRGGLAGLTLLERVIDAAATLTFQKTTKLAGGTTEAVRKAWKEAAPNLAELSDGQRFHLLFEDAVDNVLLSISKKSEKAELNAERLVIFIDDLDRCEERIIVDLLEYIKLYLGSPRCIFVLGIDDTAVLGAMRRCWTDRSEDDNREYLEKMFQATITVPLPRPEVIRRGIADQLEGHGIVDPAGCAGMIERLLEPNPRKIKNFCNSLCAVWNQHGMGTPDPAEAHRFILFHYLRLFHRPVWRILERQRKVLPMLHRVLTGSPDPIPDPEIAGFDEADQRMLRELFERAFSHVLRDDAARRGEDAFRYHLSQDLEQAVRLFEARLDSKRSDEYFIRRFRELVGKDEPLPEYCLYLALPPDAAPEHDNEILFRRFGPTATKEDHGT